MIGRGVVVRRVRLGEHVEARDPAVGQIQSTALAEARAAAAAGRAAAGRNAGDRAAEDRERGLAVVVEAEIVPLVVEMWGGSPQTFSHHYAGRRPPGARSAGVARGRADDDGLGRPTEAVVEIA